MAEYSTASYNGFSNTSVTMETDSDTGDYGYLDAKNNWTDLDNLVAELQCYLDDGFSVKPKACDGTQSLQNQQQQAYSQHQQQQQQQQRSQQQQQQYYTTQQHSQSYQHGMQNGSATLPMGSGGMLTVDSQTSTMPRSPSAGSAQLSPQSPGSVQVIHEQFGSMSRSGATTPAFPSGTLSPLFMSGSLTSSRRGSQSSEAGDSTPRFVRDTSKYWYKPRISREDAINMLKDCEPGSFVVRDSNSFPGAFGLAVRVAQLPPNIQTKPGGDPKADLVRHFLIEPTNKGVKLKGCSNEPIFASLAQLVYQHSITPMALPCRLILPEVDPSGEPDTVDGPIPSSAAAVLAQGAACNVLYINSLDVESLTGREAIAKALSVTFSTHPPPKTTVVHFKVATQGVTLTDNKRKLFFRRHYPIGHVSYCGLDPDDRRWSQKLEETGKPLNARIFGFVARRQDSTQGNSCHLFAELDPDQPATAIVNFIQKVFISLSKQQHA